MGLLALTTTAVLSSDACRIAIVLAGTALASLITAPSAIRGPMMGETGAMLEAAAVGAFTSATAIILGCPDPPGHRASTGVAVLPGTSAGAQAG